MKRLLPILILSLVSSVAQAALMDFEDFSDSNTTEGTLTSFTSGIFSVSLTAGSAQGGTDYDPYLDYGNAGVGVCKNSTVSAWPDSGTGNKCKTPDGSKGAAGDDNLQYLEFLRLDFGELVSVSDFFFRNAHHNLLNGDVKFAVDGGNFIDYSFSSGLNTSLTLTGTTIDITIGTGSNYTELYLSKLEVQKVPEPSIIALMGLGLAGLGFARRRKQKA